MPPDESTPERSSLDGFWDEEKPALAKADPAGKKTLSFSSVPVGVRKVWDAIANMVMGKKSKPADVSSEEATGETEPAQTHLAEEPVEDTILPNERVLTSVDMNQCEAGIIHILRRSPAREQDIAEVMETIRDIASPQRIELLRTIYHHLNRFTCGNTLHERCVAIERANQCVKKCGISDADNAQALAKIVTDGMHMFGHSDDVIYAMVGGIACHRETAQKVSDEVRHCLPETLEGRGMPSGNRLHFYKRVQHSLGSEVTGEEIRAAKYTVVKNLLTRNDRTNSTDMQKAMELAGPEPNFFVAPKDQAFPEDMIMTDDLRTLATKKLRFIVSTCDKKTLKKFMQTFGIAEATVQGEAILMIGEFLERIKVGATDKENIYQLTLSIKRIMEKADVSATSIESLARESVDSILDRTSGLHVPFLVEDLGINPDFLSQDPFRERVAHSLGNHLSMAAGGNRDLDQYFAYWTNCLGQCPVYQEELRKHLIRYMNEDTAALATSGAAYLPSESGVRKTFSAIKKLPPEMEITPELAHAAQCWMDAQVGNGSYQETLDFGGAMGAKTDIPSFGEAGKNGLIALLRHSNDDYRLIGKLVAFVYAIKPDIDVAMQDSVLRDSAAALLYRQLKSADGDNAMLLRKLLHLDTEFSSQLAHDAAMEGCVFHMINKRFDAMMDFAKFARIRDVDLVQKMNESIVDGKLRLKDLVEEMFIVPDRIFEKLETKYCLPDYKQDVGIASSTIYELYLRCRNDNGAAAAKSFAESIHRQQASMISGDAQDPAICDSPVYRDLVEATFPSHTGYSHYDGNESCPDRTDDLSAYKVRLEYSFIVKPGSEMRIKAGEEQDRDAIVRVEYPLQYAGYNEPDGRNTERATLLLERNLREIGERVQLEPFYTTVEEQIFGLLLRNRTGEVSAEEMRILLVGYHLAHTPEAQQYIEGTRDNVERAKNTDYQHLLELSEFYADRMKDTTRDVCDTALKNAEVRSQLPALFQKLNATEVSKEKVQSPALSLDAIGLSLGFIRQIGRTMKRDSGREHSADEVRDTVRSYEQTTGGLESAKLPSDTELSPAVYGQIRAQRSKTRQALRTLTGNAAFDIPLHLEEVRIPEAVTPENETAAVYDETLFLASIAASAKKILFEPLEDIKHELDKYEPVDSEKIGKIKKVEAYITKNHTSAHARGVAGVCVSSDNPARFQEKSMWNNPKYLQLVLRDGKTKVCQGLVLLHVEDHGDKRILTASMNPSSTYLLSVNQQEMFDGLRDQLIAFAEDNKIDAIGFSRTRNVRTNRTETEFEKAMVRALKAFGREVIFDTQRPFSAFGPHVQKEIDLIWAKNPEDFDANTSGEMFEKTPAIAGAVQPPDQAQLAGDIF